MEIVLLDDSDVGLLANSLIIGQTFPDYSLVFFKYPQAALRYFEQPSTVPTLCLIDYRMPDINGIEFMKIIQEKGWTAHRYFILFTIQDTIQLERDAIKVGYDDVLSKSEEPETIVRHLKNAIKVLEKL